ncbi:MAG: hypothetical protein ACRD5H_18090 [Nitrososphaerales archaeon]
MRTLPGKAVCFGHGEQNLPLTAQQFQRSATEYPTYVIAGILGAQFPNERIYMKRTLFLLVILLFLTEFTLQAQKPPADKNKPHVNCLVLSLKTEKDTFRLEEPINVKVSLYNASEQICKLPLELPIAFSVTVKDQYGKDVPKTKAFQDLLRSGPEKKFDYSVQPKQEFLSHSLVNSFFLIEAPGIYSITFSKDIYQSGTNRIAKITSNTIKVKVNNLVYPRSTPDCFALSAKPEKEVVRLGEPVKVSGILRNIVDEPCGVLPFEVKEDYSIIVKNASGAEVPKIEKKESPYNIGKRSYRIQIIHPQSCPICKLLKAADL